MMKYRSNSIVLIRAVAENTRIMAGQDTQATGDAASTPVFTTAATTAPTTEDVHKSPSTNNDGIDSDTTTGDVRRAALEMLILTAFCGNANASDRLKEFRDFIEQSKADMAKI
jgi:hypothetical protein